MSFGTPAYDISHLLGGGVLLLSFVMLYQRRVGAGFISHIGHRAHLRTVQVRQVVAQPHALGR